MARWTNDAMLDAALNYIKTNCDKVCICTDQPTTYTEATVTFALVVVDAVTGDFTLADGDVSGRKLTYGGAVDVEAVAGGDADHLAFAKSGTSTLLFVTTMPELTLLAEQIFDIVPFDIEIGDPVAPS